MELDEAEAAAFAGGSGAGETGGRMADVPPPRNPAEAWGRAVDSQFQNLIAFAKQSGCLLSRSDLPALDYGKGGMEHEIFHDAPGGRFWKSTFAGCSGFGPEGHFTPLAYLRRLKLSNLVFGDDVAFEGIWMRNGEPSIVTSQRYILPDLHEGIPPHGDVADYMRQLGFLPDENEGGFFRSSDGVLARDAHPRNFIRAIDGDIYAIDVQPSLKKGFDPKGVIPFSEITI